MHTHGLSTAQRRSASTTRAQARVVDAAAPGPPSRCDHRSGSTATGTLSTTFDSNRCDGRLCCLGEHSHVDAPLPCRHERKPKFAVELHAGFARDSQPWPQGSASMTQADSSGAMARRQPRHMWPLSSPRGVNVSSTHAHVGLVDAGGRWVPVRSWPPPYRIWRHPIPARRPCRCNAGVVGSGQGGDRSGREVTGPAGRWPLRQGGNHSGREAEIAGGGGASRLLPGQLWAMAAAPQRTTPRPNRSSTGAGPLGGLSMRRWSQGRPWRCGP